MITKKSNTKRDGFSGKFGIIAAAAGSAVGLGNIWKFPYEAGANGGSAFIIVYILFVVLIGLPVMLSEFIIGRNAQKNVFGAFRAIKPNQKVWGLVGMLGVFVAFIILAFYGTVAGWTVEYLYQSLANNLTGHSAEEYTSMFDEFIKNPYRPVIWQIFFMILTGLIVLVGVKNGIEKSAKIMMPLLLVLLIGLGIKALTLDGAYKGLEFLFYPDFSHFTYKSVLEALGQSFFSLSLGMGTLITYASYVAKDDNIVKTSFIVAGADTFIAILAGIVIFPAVFAFGISPGAGPGLVFVTLPNVFAQIQGGEFFAIAFFLSLTVAALTSSISLLEVIVAYFKEELKIERKFSTIIAVVVISILGVFCTLSFGPLKDFTIFGHTIFDAADFLASNIILPIGGFSIAIFVGWFMDTKEIKAEISSDNMYKIKIYGVYRFLIKYIVPFAILLVFLSSIGII